MKTIAGVLVSILAALAVWQASRLSESVFQLAMARREVLALEVVIVDTDRNWAQSYDRIVHKLQRAIRQQTRLARDVKYFEARKNLCENSVWKQFKPCDQ